LAKKDDHSHRMNTCYVHFFQSAWLQYGDRRIGGELPREKDEPVAPVGSVNDDCSTLRSQQWVIEKNGQVHEDDTYQECSGGRTCIYRSKVSAFLYHVAQ